VAHTFSGADAAHLAYRPAVGNLSFEGVAILDNGVMYYGDENRPGAAVAGGAYFKFVPATPWAGGTVSSLADSPLAAGTVYGLKLGAGSNTGQGSNTGTGTWVEMTSTLPNLRAGAATMKLSGYYRPEDLQVDLGATANGDVRVCGNNTSNEFAANWGETICITDGTLAQATAGSAVPAVEYLVIGTPQLAMPDNIAYQPGRGNWIIQEDGEQLLGNNDIWACLDDRTDDDQLSDGCVRVISLNDRNAESTGGVFDQTGKRYFVSVQHNVTGHGVVLEITGWK
jgi:secreted PhoX family phosphatase